MGGPTAGAFAAEQLLPVRLIQRRRQRKYNLNNVRHVAGTVNGLSTLTLCSDHSAISRVQRGVQLARRENALSLASSAEMKNPKMLTAFQNASGQRSACCIVTEHLTLRRRTGACKGTCS